MKQWSKNIPKKPGLYWWKNGEKCKPALVSLFSTPVGMRLHWCIERLDEDTPISEMGGLWMPVEMPKETT